MAEFGTLSTTTSLPSRNGRRMAAAQYTDIIWWVRGGLDILLVLGLLVLHTWLKVDDFTTPYRILAVITVLLMLAVYSALGLYQHRGGPFSHLLAISRAWFSVLGILIALAFVTKTSTVYSREVILTWGTTGFFAHLLSYALCTRLAHALRGGETRALRTLVVGSGDLAAHLATHLQVENPLNERLVGYVSAGGGDNTPVTAEAVPTPKAGATVVDLAHLGTTEDLAGIVDRHGIRRVYVALPMDQAAEIRPIYLGLMDRHVDVIWAPDIFGVNLLNHSIRELAGLPLISLNETPLLGAPAVMKDIMDRVLAVLALTGLAPLMLLTALAIKATSPGPVLFRQQRRGWDGDVFEVWKFRSMKVHQEGDGQVTQATKGDARVTAVGRFIRRTSIDELPQLFNVLQGKMSLVGPRPHALAHDDFYGDKIDAYMLRHRIKPGLTGLAQINGYRGETETLEKMQARIEYDLAYINTWSLWLDVKILLKTLPTLLNRNAY